MVIANSMMGKLLSVKHKPQIPSDRFNSRYTLHLILYHTLLRPDVLLTFELVSDGYLCIQVFDFV